MSKGGLRDSVIAIRSTVRHLPLLVRESPRTPLRVLCIAALDTAHVLRYSAPMPPERVRQLAAFLDFGACTNAEWDRKRLCEAEYAETRRQLDAAGLRPRVDEYLARLHELEAKRPGIAGDHRRFDEVRAYREGVVHVSLTTAAEIAMNAAPVEDSHFETLFRIVMQCQVIDDVLDYREDRSAGLPSFLTSVVPLQRAVVMTAGLARAYGGQWERTSRPAAFPMRLALSLVSAITKLIVLVAPAPLLGYSWLRESTRLHPVQWWRARRRGGVRRSGRASWRRRGQLHV